MGKLQLRDASLLAGSKALDMPLLSEGHAQTSEPLLLGELQLHTIAFVTTHRPSAAVALAVRSSLNIRVLVLAPETQRERVLQLGATWANIDRHMNATRQIEGLYRHTSADRPEFRLFTLRRWLLLAEELLHSPLPRGAAVAVVENDVLLFESMRERLAECAQFHPHAQAETVVNGAYLIGSASALIRYADFLWWLYTRPTRQLAEIVWRFGERKPLVGLNVQRRGRIDPAMIRSGHYPLFGDMDALNALRQLSRGGELPAPLRVAWAAGCKRKACADMPNARTLLSGNVSVAWERNRPYVSETGANAGGSKENRVQNSFSIEDRVISSVSGEHQAKNGVLSRNRKGGAPDAAAHIGRPYCFLHLQGPLAKQKLMKPALIHAGLDALERV